MGNQTDAFGSTPSQTPPLAEDNIKRETSDADSPIYEPSFQERCTTFHPLSPSLNHSALTVNNSPRRYVPYYYPFYRQNRYKHLDSHLKNPRNPSTGFYHYHTALEHMVTRHAEVPGLMKLLLFAKDLGLNPIAQRFEAELRAVGIYNAKARDVAFDMTQNRFPAAVRRFFQLKN
ncbi:hypothetical protein F4818DRAFT_439390 [Hypoxylon cercidicola]|nr:hypothetical protein F4818DRAFT_439390 [Hypoxylon cercidicola]